MKHRLLLLLAAAVSLASCKKAFLDRPDQNAPTLETYYTTAEQVDAAVGQLYTATWAPYMDRAFLSIGEIMGGTGITEGPGDYAPYQNFTVADNDAQVAKAWKAFYMAAGTSSVLIRAFEEKKATAGADTAYLNKGIAEASFIRAVAYFYLARVFKDVPIVTDPVKLASSSRYNVPRYLQRDVLKYVIENLKVAEAGLPETPYAPGRVTAYSAKGMMAKVYLYLKEYAHAQAKAAEVMASGKYDLFPDYYKLFSTATSNNNPESLFAFQWTANGDYQAGNHVQTNVGPQPLLDPVGAGGYSSVVPSLTLVRAFEPGDKRRSSIMEHGFSRPDWTNKLFPGGYVYDTTTGNDQLKSRRGTRSNSAKYVIGPGSNGEKVNGQSNNMNTYILRYADVLLIYAEAVLGDGASTSDPSALAAFNKVRRRAGFSPAADKTVLTKDMILHERMVEFNFEGDYWFDVQRQGFDKAKEILWAQERGVYSFDGSTVQHADVKAQFTRAEQLYLPVPAAERIVNPLLNESPVKFY